MKFLIFILDKCYKKNTTAVENIIVVIVMNNATDVKNLKEYVVSKMIDYVENSDGECAILKHIFEGEYLHCRLCNLIMAPVNKRDRKYEHRWICPCDLCFIDDRNDVYDNTYNHYFRSKGLGEPYCDEMYCKGCVEKHGYQHFFSRYNLEKKEYEYYNGDFHRPSSLDRKEISWTRKTGTYINMCKKCANEDA